MNKTQLITAIAEEAKLDKKDAEKFFSSMVNVITKNLKKDIKITVPGFITVTKVKKAARSGRNPQTGKEIKIPEKNVVKIKASKVLNDSVNL